MNATPFGGQVSLNPEDNPRWCWILGKIREYGSGTCTHSVCVEMRAKTKQPSLLDALGAYNVVQHAAR